MEINLQILKEDLRPLNFKSFYSNRSYEMTCAYPMPFVRNMPLVDNVVYIARAEDLPEDPPLNKGLSFILLGRPSSNYLCEPYSVLYTNESIEIFELLERTMAIFDRYEDWGRAMEDAFFDENPCRSIGLASLPIVENPIYLQSGGFMVLLHILPERTETNKEKFDRYLSKYSDTLFKENVYLPLDAISDLILDHEYNKALEEDKPTIYSDEMFGFRTLFFNIGTKNNYLARLCFDEIDHAFSDKDFALIWILGGYLEKVLRKRLFANFDRPQELNDVLENLLAHRLIDEQRIVAALWHLSWNMHDRFFCMVLESKSEDHTSKTLNAVARQLTDILPSECYTIFNGRLVFVFNLSQIAMLVQDVLNRILPAFRDNLLIAGISNEFDDFKNLYYYYNQALTSLELGTKLDPMLWYFRYENYALENIIRKSKGNQIKETFYPKGLKALIEFDERKDAGLVNLLKTYLDQNMNVTETTRVTFMHRSTCLYKLKRIQQISNLNLSHPDVRLELQIAFKIMELP